MCYCNPSIRTPICTNCTKFMSERIEQLEQTVNEFKKNEDPNLKIGELQAQIDRLMLEYCPKEMTKEQLLNWAKNQRSFNQ